MEAGVRDPWNPGEAFVPECPLCSGKVARDDPAVQALEWGVRVAESSRGEASFWRANCALDAARAPRERGDGSAAVQKYLAEVAGLLAGRPAPAAEADLTLWRLSEKRSVLSAAGVSHVMQSYRGEPLVLPWGPGHGDPNVPGPVAGTDSEEIDDNEEGLLSNPDLRRRPIRSDRDPEGPWPTRSPPVYGGDMFKPVCCVEKFLYPVPLEDYQVRIQPPEGHKLPPQRAHPKALETGARGQDVRVIFRAEAVYSEQDACLCECCQFAQYILMDEMSWTPAVRNNAGEHSEPEEFPDHWPLGPLTEDCVWAVYDTKSGSYQVIRGDPRKKPSPPADAPDKPVYGPYCFGDRDVHEDFVAHDLADDLVQTFSECKYEMIDRPAEWVPIDHWWDWRLIFLGVIHDRCNNWIPRRMKLFDASNKGMTALPEGRVTQQPSK